MSIRTIILIVSPLIFVVVCDQATSWPPNRTKLMYVFDQQKATFVLIEQEMAADGLKRMGPILYSQTQSTPTVTKLPSLQASKYAALFERTQMYLDVTRREQYTAFELLLQNDGPRLYLSRFLHTASDLALPSCAPAMQLAACGTCSIHLESEWMLEYSWFPADPELEALEC